MKTLYLLRHAKASWKKEDVSDRERPLKKKGRLQADAMSDHLASLLPPPQAVLCSPSVRTRETLSYFLELWSVAEQAITFPDALYLAERDALEAEIQKLSDKTDIAMVVGHNPGLTDVVQNWNTSDASYVKSIRTCGFIQLDFQTDSWSGLSETTGQLKLDLRPKQLQA